MSGFLLTPQPIEDLFGGGPSFGSPFLALGRCNFLGSERALLGREDATFRRDTAGHDAIWTANRHGLASGREDSSLFGCEHNLRHFDNSACRTATRLNPTNYTTGSVA